MWSLGVILYILLSGLPPFWGDTEDQIFKMVLKGHIDFKTDPWPKISEAAKDCVRRLLDQARACSAAVPKTILARTPSEQPTRPATHTRSTPPTYTLPSATVLRGFMLRWPSLRARAAPQDVTKRATAAQILKHEWLVKEGVALDIALDSVVLKRLKQFAQMNKLKKACLMVIGQHLTPDEIAGAAGRSGSGSSRAGCRALRKALAP
jgi:serine/threonine protein kinase